MTVRDFLKEFLGIYSITLMTAGFLLCVWGAGGNFNQWSQRLKRRLKRRAERIVARNIDTAPRLSYLKLVGKQGYLQRDSKNRDIDRGKVIAMIRERNAA